MLDQLPDPRRYATADGNPLEQQAAKIAGTADGSQRAVLWQALQLDLKNALIAGRDDLISTAVAEVSSAAAGRVLWDAVDEAINAPGHPDAQLVAGLFAIPVVFVAGGLAGAEIPGVIGAVRKLCHVLESEGALGVTRNFGLNQALCADTSMEAFSPSRLYALLGRVENEGVELWPDLIPAEIHLVDANESVALRFITGIAITGTNAPSFISSAGDIGRWGMPFARELIQQLCPPGVSLLPIPRPASGLLRALHRGHQAREEIAFQTFASRVLREFRASVGEPRARVSAVAPNCIDVAFSSDFDASRTQMHRWVLHPLDDLHEIASNIGGLLADCKIQNVEVVDQIASAAVAFPGSVSAPHLG
ncbi:MAG: hypothetical protein ABI612_13300 [Betaproteobacteria bacterium]